MSSVNFYQDKKSFVVNLQAQPKDQKIDIQYVCDIFRNSRFSEDFSNKSNTILKLIFYIELKGSNSSNHLTFLTSSILLSGFLVYKWNTVGYYLGLPYPGTVLHTVFIIMLGALYRCLPTATSILVVLCPLSEKRLCNGND